jgi:ACS family 4-hydroxyphenylacetate permease-like MFS transporter
MLTAEHKADPRAAVRQRSQSLFSELTSATVLKFSIAYFCLVNSLAMVAVWTP